MNFSFTKEQELVKQMVREFAINEVKPIKTRSFRKVSKRYK